MILILGAGISGLSAAAALKTPNYLILEKAAEPGGYCRTVKQDGFVWDYSGHFFHFRHPDIKAYLLEKMDAAGLLTVQKRSQIYYDGQYIDFPFQKNIHQLPQQAFIDCLHDLYFRPALQPTSFKEMLVTKFGQAICQKFLLPYNEKLYACDLDTLDVDAMGRFFPHADLADIIRNFKTPDNASYNSTFTYHKEGAYTYIESLLKRVDPAKLALNEEVIAIDLKTHTVVTNQRRLTYERIISSIPFNHLLKLTDLPHDPPIYHSNKVLVFNLGFDKKGDSRNHWVYYPDPEICFYRIGYYDNIFDDERMSLYVEIGLKTDAVYDCASTLNRVLADLQKTGVTTDHQLIAYHSVLLDPAYVHITAQSRQDVQARMAEFNAWDVFSIGRYGGWTYCAIEDNIVEARELVNRLGV